VLVQVAEDSFQRGQLAMDQGRQREALAYFEAAVALERRFGVARPQARYLSNYGLCLGLNKVQLAEAIKYCQAATGLEQFDAELHFNLGRVYLLAGRRKRAYQSLLRGLRLQPDHAGIRRELQRMGRRRRPVLPFLARGNALNVLLGRRRTGG
jgi:tetratricopeptide (TPR) repeat protein